MHRALQREIVGHDPRAINQYSFPGAGRIRRHLLEHTIDGMDYYGEAFRALNLRGNESILIAGTGDGLDEARLAVEFGHTGRIIGIDLEMPNVDFEDNFIVAKQELVAAGKSNVSYEIGNAMALNNFEDNEFDVVMWNHSAYHFTDIYLASGEARRVLKRGGKLLNLTNGDLNKYGHHNIVRSIKSQLGVNHHEPFSAPFDMQTSRRALRRLIGHQIASITQATLYKVTLDNLADLENSIDTYKNSLPRDAARDWADVRSRTVDEAVVPYFRFGGYYDFAYRGGGIYENAKHLSIVQLHLGKAALAEKKEQPLATDSSLAERL